MTVDEKTVRDLKEDNNALREDLRRLRADLDVLRSGRLGVLGFKTAALVGDNGLATAKYKDGSVTPAKLADGISRTKLETTESETITVEAGAGYSFPQFQITELGVQILADDTNENPPVILFVPAYVTDLGYVAGEARPDVDFWSGVVGNADNTDNYIKLISRNYEGNLTTWFGSVLAYADGSSALVELKAQNNAGTATEAQLIAYATGLGVFEMVSAMLLLDNDTADPTLNVFDGALLYRSDTDKFRARVNGAWVNLLTSADTEWVDLTDGGETTLHTHAGGAGLKTSGGGYYLIPAGPAAGTAAVDSATDNTYGAWVEMRAAAGNALFIVGVTVRANSPPGTTGDYVQLDIGTGAAASETSISEAYFADVINGGQHIEFPFPIPVAASTRIAVRVADSETVANTYEVTLQVIDQADLVEI